MSVRTHVVVVVVAAAVACCMLYVVCLILSVVCGVAATLTAGAPANLHRRAQVHAAEDRCLAGGASDGSLESPQPWHS